MPLALLGFIRNNWMVIAAGIVIAAMLGYISILRFTISNQTKEIGELAAINSVLTVNVANLKEAIRIQNESIDHFASKTKEYQKRIDALNFSVVNQQSKLATKMLTIQTETLPSTCEHTIKYLIDAVPEYKP